MNNGGAIEKDEKVFLKSTDSGDMYSYVMKQAWVGTAIGTAVAGVGVLGLSRFSSVFRRYTNSSAKAFLIFAGAGTGFSLASDWAMVHYYRFMDRPELSGFTKLNDEKALLEKASQTRSEIVKDWAWNNRFRLIGAAWAATMASVIYKDYSNPNLNSVAKFGHARIAAQGVTIAALIAAFAFNAETGPWADKYKPSAQDNRGQ